MAHGKISVEARSNGGVAVGVSYEFLCSVNYDGSFGCVEPVQAFDDFSH